MAGSATSFVHPKSHAPCSQCGFMQMKPSVTLPRRHIMGQTKLQANESSDDNGKSGKAQGVYVRPSGAIERGSGFFVPGLEGPKVRFLFGSVLLVLTAVNHWVASLTTTSLGWSLEEGIAIGYALLVFFQAAIEYGKEELIVEGDAVSNSSKISGSSSGTSENLVQQWSKEEGASESIKERVQWAAASFMSVTPATQLMLLQGDKILYRLGNDSKIDGTSNDVEKGVQAAFSQLEGSKGGRLALPQSHPAVQGLGLDECRTVVLQRISPTRCWVMSSQDQLLASFTSSDLKWLGHMATYVQQ